MMKNLPLSLLWYASLSTIALHAQPEFELDFEGPDTVLGAPGEKRGVEFWARVRSLPEIGDASVRAWSVGIVADGASIESAVLPPDIVALPRQFQHIELLEGGGVVTAVVLGDDENPATVLDPSESPRRILRLTLGVAFAGACTTAGLRYVDGLQGEAEPVENIISSSQGESEVRLTSKSIALELESGCGPASRSSSFEFELAGPDRLVGSPGEVQEFEVTARLVVRDIPTEISGANAWSMSVETQDAIVVEASLPAAILGEAPRFSFCKVVENRGAVAAVVLDDEMGSVLSPSQSPHDILNLSLKAQIGSECRSAWVRFVDGLRADAAPVDNIVTADQKGYLPALSHKEIRLERSIGCAVPPASSPFLFDFGGELELTLEVGQELEFVVQARIRNFEPQAEEQNPEPLLAAQAWSMAIVAEGCRLQSATLSEAISLRQPEFSHVELIGDAGVTCAVVLDYEGGAELEAGEGPQEVLDLTLQIPGTADCSTCRLRYVDGLRGDAHAVDNVVTVGQQGYAPLLIDKEIRFRETLTCEEGVELPVLREIELATCSSSACFELQTPVGEPILLEIADEDSRNSHALFARWGSEATTTDFDLKADRRRSARQTLVVPSARGESLHVLVQSTHLANGNAAVEFTARVIDLGIEDVYPLVGGRGGRALLVLRGAGFESGVTQFSLVDDGGESINATTTRIFSEELAEVEFDLADAELGDYEVTAFGIEGSPPVPFGEAFRVLTPIEAFGVEVTIDGQDRYRRDRLATLQIAFRNLELNEKPAPIVLVRAPPRTRLGLQTEDELGDSSLLVAGWDRRGRAGVLAPFASGEVPVVLKSLDGQGQGRVSVNYRVDLLTPLRTDTINWLSVDPGFPSWAILAPRLERKLGSTWVEFHQNLTPYMTRLGRRGVDVADLDRVFRFAAREALELPIDAVVGTLIAAGDRAPIAGAVVACFNDGNDTPASFGRTDSNGRFVVDWLVHGEAYTLRASGYQEEFPVNWAEAGDEFLGELSVTSGGEPIEEECANCDASLDDLRVVHPPERVLTPIFEWETTVAGPVDPNEKHGPEGEGEELFGVPQVSPTEPLFYTIYFENKPGEEVLAARRVTITDDLDSDLDWGSVRFHYARFGDQIITFDGDVGYSAVSEAGTRFVNPQFELDLDVRVDANLNLQSGRITWTFDTLDPGNVLPDDVGFLPPNDSSGRGEGAVTFSVKPKPNVDDEDVVVNDALIIFDSEPPIRTRAIRHQINFFLPVGAPSHPQPSDGGQADPGGGFCWAPVRRAAYYDLRFWRLDAPANITVVRDLRQPCFRPEGGLGLGTYGWQVMARNVRDVATPGPEWSFAVAEERSGFRRGDADAQGLINLTDGVFLLNFLFLGGPPPPCIDAADFNDDEILNITDGVALFNWLFLGGSVPPAPGPLNCGSDPTGTDLSCDAYDNC